jgi:hypothetical protein
LWLWDDSETVSMAVSREPIEGVVRLSGVYTPPDKRKRGYAAACVHALSKHLRDAGSTIPPPSATQWLRLPTPAKSANKAGPNNGGVALSAEQQALVLVMESSFGPGAIRPFLELAAGIATVGSS